MPKVKGGSTLRDKMKKFVDLTWKYMEIPIPVKEPNDEAKKAISALIREHVAFAERRRMQQLYGVPAFLETNEEILQALFPWGIPEDEEVLKKYIDKKRF